MINSEKSFEIVDLPPASKLWEIALPVLQQLRTEALTPQKFAEIYKNAWQSEGLRYIGMFCPAQVDCVAIAGVRKMHKTAALGAVLYVEDLVVSSEDRRQEVGKAMMEELAQYASKIGCVAMTLEADINQEEPQRFYEALGAERIAYAYTIAQ